jgi:hypothetical protein
MEDIEKREPETPIARLRNSMQPMVTYFCMRKQLDEDETITDGQRDGLRKLAMMSYDQIQGGQLDKMLALLKDDSQWPQEPKAR